MPAQVEERALSLVEQEYLQSTTEHPLNGPEGIKELPYFFMLWGWGSLLSGLFWLFVAWLVRITTGIDFGWNSDAAPWIKSLGVIAWTTYFAFILVDMFRFERARRSSTHLDLEKNRVIEEHYEFSAAMRMQEQEHGGLIYFLHLIDGTVLVLFDYESQDLGAGGEDPMTSSFAPRTRLKMVRAPESETLIETTFSGDVLDAGEPLVLTASPGKWPEFEKVCDIPWQELEARLCG